MCYADKNRFLSQNASFANVLPSLTIATSTIQRRVKNITTVLLTAINRIREVFALTMGDQPFAVFVSILRPQDHGKNIRDATRNLSELSFNMGFGTFLIPFWYFLVRNQQDKPSDALHEVLIQLHTVSPPL